MNHGSSCGVGHDRSWLAAHLIQTAAGAGKAHNDGGDKHHEDGQANGHGRSEPHVSLRLHPRGSCSPGLPLFSSGGHSVSISSLFREKEIESSP